MDPSKEFLKSWYGRRGYRLSRTGRIDDAYPHLASLLATPCYLAIFEKPLQPHVGAEDEHVQGDLRPSACRAAGS